MGLYIRRGRVGIIGKVHSGEGTIFVYHNIHSYFRKVRLSHLLSTRTRIPRCVLFQIIIGIILFSPSQLHAQVCSCSTTDTACPECNDDIDCTADLCSLDGQCWHLSVTSRCDDGLACTLDSCNLDTGQCDHTPKNDPSCVGNCCEPGEACREPDGFCFTCTISGDCNDGLVCNGTETCFSGTCVQGTPIDCSFLDSICTAGVCDNDLEDCVSEPANEDAQCDDGDHCSAVDFCTNGICLGGVHPDSCISLILETPDPGNLSVGQIVHVRLMAYAQGCGALPLSTPCQTSQHELAGINTIITWNPSVFQLRGHVDPCRTCNGGANQGMLCDDDSQCPDSVCIPPEDACFEQSFCPTGTYNWATSGFPPDASFDGINIPDPTTSLGNDGNAFYAVTRQTLCGVVSEPACAATVSQGGLHVTTFEFEILNIPTSRVTEVSFLPCIGLLSKTRVISNQFQAYNKDITLPLGLCDLGSNFPFDPCNTDADCPGGGCTITSEQIDFSSCDPSTVESVAGRYLTIVPPGGTNPVALLVTGSAGDSNISCVSQYVQADGLLGDIAVYQTPAQWGTVSVRGDAIRPSSTYDIRTDCGPVPGEVLSDPVNATTWGWGDVNHDGSADISDVILVIDGFLGIFVRLASPCTNDSQCSDPISNAPFFRCDTTLGFCVNATIESLDIINASPAVFGCVPDGAIDIADVLDAVDAFLGFSIPCSTVCP